MKAPENERISIGREQSMGILAILNGCESEKTTRMISQSQTRVLRMTHVIGNRRDTAFDRHRV